MAARVRLVDGPALNVGISCRARSLFGIYTVERSQLWSELDYSLLEPGLSPGAPPYLDPIQHFTHHYFGCVARLGAMNAEHVLGISSAKKHEERLLIPFIKGKPYRKSLDTFPVNIMGQLQAVIRPPRARRGFRDNFVTHFNATGLFTPKPPDVIDTLGVGTVEQIDGFQILLNRISGHAFSGMVSPYPFNIDDASGWASLERWMDLVANLNFWRKNPGALRIGEGFPEYVFVEVSNINWDVNDRGLTVWYNLHSGYQHRDLNIDRKVGIEGTWACKLEFKLNPTGELSTDPTRTTQWCRAYTASVVYSYRLITGKSHFWHPDIDDGNLQTIIQPTYSGSYVSPAVHEVVFTSVPFRGDNIDAYSKALSMVLAHGHRFNDELGNLAGSAVYAFHDAVHSQLQILQNNYLEFLSEVDGLPELIPDFEPLLRFLTDMSERRFVKSLRSLGDFVAGNHLLWSFGIAPDIRIVDELNRLGPRLLDSFQHERYPQSGAYHGRFLYNFIDTEVVPYKGSRLLTRVTSDITFPRDSFSVVLYTLYGSGLLPSLSNLWAVKSMSFVIDWFTNVGSRLKAVDLSIIAFMLQVDFTTVSHTVTTPGDGVIQADFDPAFFDLVYYVRRPTAKIPGLLYSRFDFMRAGGPDLGLVSSLIYVFLPK